MMEKTILLDGNIWAKKWQTDHDFSFFIGKPDNEYLIKEGYIYIAPYRIELVMPAGIDLYASHLQSLQVKRKLILAENESRLNVVDEEIKNHLALEQWPLNFKTP